MRSADPQWREQEAHAWVRQFPPELFVAQLRWSGWFLLSKCGFEVGPMCKEELLLQVSSVFNVHARTQTG
ncbi:hypothetical protein CRENBAI_024478 [Crenichthys baileyi]|uniref:Uncharacterized protein n=1 Tax=Crenichthys baileyi TaxID=28760 RepID=A0AAV9S3V9_9TELE